MVPIIVKYPLDLTGKNPTNLVINEYHDLADQTGDPYRVFVPDYGSFYTNGLKVRDASGTLLTPKVDYIATYLYEEASKRTGLEVMGAIVILNPNVSSSIYIDAQMVGGDYAQNVDAVQQVIDSINEDDSPVKWGNVIGKPSQYPPGGHLHALWELYGFEYLVVELERITQAIYTGDEAAFDEIRDLIEAAIAECKTYTDNKFSDIVTPHINDKDNPHEVTKEQVGLGDVRNFPMANESEARAMTRDDRYMSPNNVGQAIAEHSSRGDHDDRYARINASVEGSLRVNDGRLEAFVDGNWRIIWPAQWV